MLVASATMIAAPAKRDQCSALATLSIPQVVITAAGRIDGDVCRVSGTAHPVAGSNIGFEIRLPAASQWSGRYYQVGNGGFGGAIHEPTLAEGAARGDAVAGTDTGHRANAFDASWAQGNPERVVDYAYRSIKATSDVGAVLVRSYYGYPARRRYFMGCSNGGRMALMAAARYPDDWDGVISGSPANPWTRQLAAFSSLELQVRRSPAGWLTRDDIVNCRAAIFRCRDKLSPAKRASLDAIDAAGYDLSQADPDDWVRWIINPDPSAPSQKTLGEQASRYLLALPDIASMLDIAPIALSRFRAKGGRILSYVGEADAVVSPKLGRQFYYDVARANGGLLYTRSFYRLFSVPGMLHCQGGSKPSEFGQSLESPPIADDATHDIRRAMERWVESGKAPTVLIAGVSAATISVAKSQRLRPL